MAGSVNKVILVGNLGADPEVRNLANGNVMASFNIATSESWRDKGSGERREKTEWHKIVIYNEALCGIAEQYLRKGSTVYVEGQLQTRKWQDQSGSDRYSTEVILQGFNAKLVMLGGRGDNSGGSTGGNSGGGRSERRNDDYGGSRSGGGNNYGGGRSSGGGGGGSPGRSGYGSDLDDDIPFAPEWR